MQIVYFDVPKINWPRMTGFLIRVYEPDNSIVLPCSWFPHPILLRSLINAIWIPVLFFFIVEVRLALLLQYTSMCGLAQYRTDIEMAPKSITEVIH